MVVKKRCLLWDWTNTNQVPNSINQIDFNGPISAVSNWNAWVPPELKGRAPFRPMVHLEAQLSGNDWAIIEKSDQPIVHFFNEPERNGISAQTAANHWLNQMVPYAHQKNKKLVSPSCTGNDDGLKWLAQWMDLVKSHPPEYIGIHYYGTEGSAAKAFLEKVHAKYPQHKIIVSEIASTSRDIHSVVGFTGDMANWMDKTDWIFEYGFFGCMTHVPDNFVSPQAQLMKADGTFTPLMELLNHKQPLPLSL